MSLLDPSTAVPQLLDQGVLGADVEAVALLPPPADVPPSGHVTTITWRGVPAATGAVVTSSTVVVVPELAGTRDLGVVAGGASRTTSITVDSPAPGALVRGLRIPDLVRHDGEDDITINGLDDLAGFRLVLTPIVGGEELAPVVAVPAIPRKKALPAQLVGGSLQGAFLALPDIVGDRFLVTLVEGDAPEDFDRATFSHGDVRMYAVPGPVGLHVDGPDGAELHALAGPVQGTARVDVTAAVQRHLDGIVGADDVTASVTVRSDVVGSAAVAWTTHGHIERALPDRLTVAVDGAGTALPAPSPVPTRPPQLTVGTITVTHHGSALHPLSDPVPDGDADLGGPVVRDEPVVRELPPQALLGERITRVGIIGWVLEDADLTVEVLGRTAGVIGLVAVTRRSPPDVVWLAFDEPVDVDGPVQVSVTATRGAFGWIADPEPLLRIAVVAAPDGQVVRVGGQAVRLFGEETVAADRSLTGAGVLAPDGAPAGTEIDGWAVDTDQFCTVALSAVVMEFAP